METPAAPTRLERSMRILSGWSAALRYLGIFALFLIVYLLMLRPIRKELLNTFRELPGQMARSVKEAAKTGVTLPNTEAVQIESPSGADDGRRAGALKRQLSEKVKSEPAAASRLVQSWIREDHAE